MGEYAEASGTGEGASNLVNGFFGALQAYDYCLFESIRFEKPIADNAPELLNAAVVAMDRCAPVKDESKSRLKLR